MSDHTHIEWTDAKDLERLTDDLAALVARLAYAPSRAPRQRAGLYA